MGFRSIIVISKCFPLLLALFLQYYFFEKRAFSQKYSPLTQSPNEKMDPPNWRELCVETLSLKRQLKRHFHFSQIRGLPLSSSVSLYTSLAVTPPSGTPRVFLARHQTYWMMFLNFLIVKSFYVNFVILKVSLTFLMP